MTHVFKNFLGLSPYDFIALISIERARTTAFELYKCIVKRNDLYRLGVKSAMNRLYYEDKNDRRKKGITSDIERKYYSNTSQEEIIALANMNDYADELINEHIEVVRKVIQEEFGRKAKRNQDILGECYFAITAMSLFYHIVNRIEEVNGPYIVSLCRSPRDPISRANAFAIRKEPILAMISAARCVLTAILNGDVFTIQIDEEIEKRSRLIVDKIVALESMSMILAEGGIDIRENKEERIIHNDVPELKKSVSAWLNEKDNNKT